VGIQHFDLIGFLGETEWCVSVIIEGVFKAFVTHGERILQFFGYVFHFGRCFSSLVIEISESSVTFSALVPANRLPISGNRFA
jgi:hypothetical protein